MHLNVFHSPLPNLQVCNATFPAITSIGDCSRAATYLGTQDNFAGYTNNTALPAGCYFKTSNYYNPLIGHHNTSLWFNVGGNPALADPDRLSLCGTLPPPTPPTSPAPTGPSQAPTPAYCVDRPRSQTGYRLRYANGTVHPASCDDLLRVNGCTHATLSSGVMRVCCLTCLGHQVSRAFSHFMSTPQILRTHCHVPVTLNNNNNSFSARLSFCPIGHPPLPRRRRRAAAAGVTVLGGRALAHVSPLVRVC
jgi:hypothetical protein